MARTRELIISSYNPGKIREIRQVLGELPVRIAGLDEFPGIPEPEEHGATFAENARDKALYYAAATGRWCLADDSGLVVDALGGEPGVRSARYAADRCGSDKTDRDGIDRANNAKLLEKLQNIPDEKRTARFVCHLALAEPGRIIVETFDTIEGVIARRPSGENGFGYDPLFFVPEFGCTTAQLPPEKKNEISHRGKAVRHFAKLLRSFLSRGPDASAGR